MFQDPKPIGDHRQNMRGRKESEDLQLAVDAQMVTCTSLNGFGLAQAYRLAGMPAPVFRDSNMEIRQRNNQGIVKFPTAQSVWDEMNRVVDAHGGETGVYFNISCEVGMDKALYDDYITLMKLSSKSNRPLGMVFSNAAYLPSWWDVDKGGNHYLQEGPQNYLRALHDYKDVKTLQGLPAFFHGDHWYTSGTWCEFSNSGQFTGNPHAAFSDKWDTGEYHIDWSKPQWHLGNKYQGIRDALGWRWEDSLRKWVAKDKVSNPLPPPRTIITECLFGSMSIPQLLQTYPNWIETNPFKRDIRGYRAHANQWASWYKGTFSNTSVGYILRRMLGQFWLYLLEPEEIFWGVNHFSAGSTGPDPGGNWDADNTAFDNDYREGLKDQTALQVPVFRGPAPQPVPTPDPTPDFHGTFVAEPDNYTVNIRRKPSTSTEVLGSIQHGDLLDLSEPFLNEDRFWYYVHSHRLNVKGYVASDVLPISPYTPPPPDPEPPPLSAAEVIEAWEASLADQRQKLDAFILKLPAD